MSTLAQWRAAQDRFDALLDRQQAALDGAGPMPPADELRKARADVEAALAVAEATRRTAGKAA